MGALNRRIEIVTRSTGPDSSEARVALEDDFHHFRVTVRQQAGRVAEAIAAAPRYPNGLCPAAGQRIAAIVGMPLNAASAAVLEVADARQQCTHQFDMAGLGVAALAQARPRRVYEACVPDRVDGRTTATLQRDGERALRWEVADLRLVGPEPFVDRDLGSGFTGFARTLSLDEAEATLVLRRAVFISRGRGANLDVPGRGGPLGGCWAWQPERAAEATALRMVGSTWDFTDRAEALAQDDRAWLAFEE